MGVMETVIELLYYLALLLGSLVILASIVSLIITAIIAVLLAYSFKTGNVLFPNLVISGMFFFESPVKTVFRTFGVNDSKIDRIAIGLKNKAICPTFRKFPYSRRAIFFPQCVRSIHCPAALSPEGIMCKDCGACGIGAAKKEAKKLGYQFFIVPGSSFILRLIRQYQPQAIIGVGCLCEVREGLDMMHRAKIPAMGVILDKSGCIATTLNWEKLYEIMNLHEPNSKDEVESADSDSPAEAATTPQ